MLACIKKEKAGEEPGNEAKCIHEVTYPLSEFLEYKTSYMTLCALVLANSCHH